MLDPELFHYVIDPVRKAYPDRIVCGCMVPFQAGEWSKMIECLEDGLFDQTPINTVAAYCGDTLFVKTARDDREDANLSRTGCGNPVSWSTVTGTSITPTGT